LDIVSDARMARVRLDEQMQADFAVGYYLFLSKLVGNPVIGFVNEQPPNRAVLDSADSPYR
jgi:hypothetical protein